jgi:hypothetical protein
VELLRRYSNQPQLTKSLVSLLQLVAIEPSAAAEPQPLVSADGSGSPRQTLATLMSAADVQAMVKSYLSGRKIVELAVDFDVSDSSIKRLLRQHSARKYRTRQK